MRPYSEYAHASISMVKDEEFVAHLQNIIQSKQITHFLETGTFNGLGSTTMIAEAIIKAGVPVEVFYTLERDPFYYNVARKHLKKYPFIVQVLGLSVGEEEAIHFLNNDEFLSNHQAYDDIFIDDIKDPRSFYINEIKGNLSGQKKSVLNPFIKFVKNILNPTPRAKDNQLRKIASVIADKKPLILLDSAGGIGYLEFLTVMEVMKNRPFTIILDDTHHIKHWRSRRDILANPNFEVLYESKTHGNMIATSDK
jgi:hypothetical protein